MTVPQLSGLIALVYIAIVAASFWGFKRGIEECYGLPNQRFTEMPLFTGGVCLGAALQVPVGITRFVEWVLNIL